MLELAAPAPSKKKSHHGWCSRALLLLLPCFHVVGSWAAVHPTRWLCVPGLMGSFLMSSGSKMAVAGLPTEHWMRMIARYVAWCTTLVWQPRDVLSARPRRK